MSDGAAADALLSLTGPAEVVAILGELGVRGIAVRHLMGELTETIVADGLTYAVAALTESHVPTPQQPAAEALMGRVARALRDHLRSAADPRASG
ncbi:hypothetical protein [Leifsonia sp. NPDC058248]|uniref:hypothetical protein n=1 Tax=Leifsonia sp. NPDC058248 TaxID=3346402 RepID=UPI0036DA6AA3